MARSRRSLFRPFLARRNTRRTPSQRLRFRPMLDELEPRCVLAPATYYVGNTNDSGFGSFRKALELHSQNADPGDIIYFEIPNNNPSTPTQIIHVNSPLPAITTGVRIDGITHQTRYAVPAVMLWGTAGDGDGLHIQANGTNVWGLIISAFPSAGIFIDRSNNDTILNCWIGTDQNGTASLGNALTGIFVRGSNNSIGAASGIPQCVISGNGDLGIRIDGTNVVGTSNNNTVSGALIGTDASGTYAIPNAGDGIRIFAGASNNVIGVDGLGRATQSNVISGNGGNGINVTGAGTATNIIGGNLIGLNSAGTAAVPNGADGVLVTAGSSNNTIGGRHNINGNTISGNSGNGVRFDATDDTDIAHANSVAGNYIGLLSDGVTPQGNVLNGVCITGGSVDGSYANTIGGNGGVSTGSGNVISGNHQAGIAFNGGPSNLIAGNYIGTDKTGTSVKTGTATLDNWNYGIVLQNSANKNTIGAAGGGSSNVISGNGIHSAGGNKGMGIAILGSDYNVIAGNFIGTDVSGTVALGNRTDGIYVDPSSAFNTIGGTAQAARNIVSGNGKDGVGYGIDMQGSNNLIEWNYFGLNVNGGQLPNAQGGANHGGTNNTWGDGTVDNNQYQTGG